MDSIFTKIIKGEIPCYRVAEDDDYFAFLDINPLKRGHTLVVPKQQVDYVFKLNDEQYLGLFAFAKKVAAAIEKAIPCQRIGIAVIGLEVPHAHIHLVPIDDLGDLDFSNPKLKLNEEEFKAIASSINKAFAG